MAHNSLSSLAAWLTQQAAIAWREWLKRRHSYRLTLEGYLFIAVTFAIGLAAFNTGTNLLYLICSMLLSFLILSGLVSTNSLRGLSITRSAPRYAMAGEPCRIEIMLRNRKRWTTSYSLRIVDRLATREIAGAAYVLMARRRSTTHASYRTAFPVRGRKILRDLIVTSRFPFGLIERSWSTAEPREILVYPRVADIRPILKKADVDLGDMESGKRGPGVSLLQLREYSGRESARSIHWKTSARTGRLMVQEFEKEEKRRITLYLHNARMQASPSDVDARFERAVVLIASLAKHFLQSDHQVRLVTAFGRVPFGSGISHLHRCLRVLAAIELAPGNSDTPHLPPPQADSTNLYVHYDPARSDQVYAASATVLNVEDWWDLLDPLAGGEFKPESPFVFANHGNLGAAVAPPEANHAV